MSESYNNGYKALTQYTISYYFKTWWMFSFFMCLEFSQPITPWFRSLYDLYSFYLMPALGKLLVGSRRAYTYLPESIRLFPDPDGLKAILENIGFTRVHYRRLTNGIAVIHIGTKP